MANPRKKGKAGSGYGLKKTKDPKGTVDSQTEHKHPSDQGACDGGPETEEFHDCTDFRF